jgi:N-acetylglutamate synthase-like GNAT family acetyltransferase
MGEGMEEVRIRNGRPSDEPALVRLLASEQMATDVDPTEFVLAEANGRLLGAVRLAWIKKGDAFLRPIVVAEGARGRGLGRALLERLFGICSSITVIARSDAVPFYRRLGFTDMDWSLLPGEYRDECACCDDLAQCRPMSMKWTLENEGTSFP